jgi:hypothetical protein
MGLDATSTIQDAWDQTPEGGTASFDGSGSCNCGCPGKPPCPPAKSGNTATDISASFRYSIDAMVWIFSTTVEKVDMEVTEGAIHNLKQGNYTQAIRALVESRLKIGKGRKLVKKLFKFGKKNNLPTPDLNPDQFKKVGGKLVHKETGAIYTKSHTSHGNTGNTGTQWKAYPKGTKDFGKTSKSTGTRVTIDGEGKVVGN